MGPGCGAGILGPWEHSPQQLRKTPGQGGASRFSLGSSLAQRPYNLHNGAYSGHTPPGPTDVIPTVSFSWEKARVWGCAVTAILVHTTVPGMGKAPVKCSLDACGGLTGRLCTLGTRRGAQQPPGSPRGPGPPMGSGQGWRRRGSAHSPHSGRLGPLPCPRTGQGHTHPRQGGGFCPRFRAAAVPLH